MKAITHNSIKSFFLVAALIIFASCERELSDEAVFATYPQNGDVFIDNFSAGLDYFPFVDAGADPTAFEVVTNDVYSGTAAMRFDIPTFGNGFVGATFNTTANRDLSEFDALTFYAKASQAASIDAIGFGINGETGNKYQVTMNGLAVSTAWKKYIVPIPDASKLTNETGLFWLAEGASFEGDEGGYVLMLDEIKFEKLGTIAQPKPAIFDGESRSVQTINGATQLVSGLSQTFNLATGENVTVTAAPSYFDFSSSEPSVATVSELGEINVLSKGDALITATLNGTRASGSMEVSSFGVLQAAPVPTTPQANVRSIFSDAYASATDSNFAPGFGGSTTETNVLTANGDSFLSYANNNFTGIMFSNTVDASAMTTMHVDVFVLSSDVSIGFQIRDIGANQSIETDPFSGNPIGDDKDLRFEASGLTVGQWNSIEIPLTGDLASQKNNLGAIILTGGPNFILDNIYFYAE